MPELPEVQTTASILNRLVSGLFIRDAWTDYGGAIHKGKPHIKDGLFFRRFKKAVHGKKIESVGRQGKNVLIYLSGGLVIIIHMKMTGHLLYGRYIFRNGIWEASEVGPLRDPYNRFIHFVLEFRNGKHLALSDMRKFAKVTTTTVESIGESEDISKLGPDPTRRNFKFADFKKRLASRPSGKIKQVLMDQTILAGIGNIYSDEILFGSSVHPLSRVSRIPETSMKKMFSATKKILDEGVRFGGDSMSDYRNPYGKPGKFQYHHKAYRRTGEKCAKAHCGGIIKRTKVGGRSAHFCPKHQKLYK